jgi:hypothetical protein
MRPGAQGQQTFLFIVLAGFAIPDKLEHLFLCNPFHASLVFAGEARSLPTNGNT